MTAMPANSSMRDQVATYISKLQDKIVSTLEELDPGSPPFVRNSWDRAEGGNGRSCTFSSFTTPGAVLEKAGVNISMIKGKLPPPAIKQMATEHSTLIYNPDDSGSLPFFAGGISLVLHPANPNAPTVHANYRYFEITESTAEDSRVVAWWFGGITDLTPSYLFEEDARHFHGTLRAACEPHGGALYPAFKKSCDDYFFIKHRGEHRGVGGIRFDDLCDGSHMLLDNSTPRPRTAEAIFAFVQACADAFLPSYIPILTRRLGMPTDDRMRRWQLLRRGRYIEFNLVYDRGTKFGLATPGVQVENVLMTMPEVARWEYMSDLGVEGDGSEESRMVEALKRPREWV